MTLPAAQHPHRLETVDGPAGPIELRRQGDGQPVVFLPSLGRGANDFDDLATEVACAGFGAIAPQPRGIGESTGSLDRLSMFDLAADVATVIEALDLEPAILIGHAFGNRVARMTATEHPELVEALGLLCCGGLVPARSEITAALTAVFDPELTPDDHLAAVATAFFAPGNDPSVWSDGWYGIVAASQAAATAALPVAHWWDAGGHCDVLVVQPEDDVLAVAENATMLMAEIGDRGTLVTISGAGHALLPEQPGAVADAVITWLRRPSSTP